ncbi:MAG: transglycosylase domain-containing protein [Actinomycetota bacterium]
MTRKGWWLTAAGAGFAFVGILVVGALAVGVPSPENASGGRPTEVLATDGKVIGTLQAEHNRKIVPFDQISPLLRKAVVATEDRNFYNHKGVSFKGTIRALFTNVREGGVAQGGSTITQQYARVAFSEVGRQRSIFRKIKEIALAKKIERQYSKDKILGLYLNTVYFGRGAYGAEAAAQTYFRKPASGLDLSQASYLAGVLRSPRSYQVDKNPEAAVRIRNEVLGDMVKTRATTQPEADKAKSTDLVKQVQLGPAVKIDSARAGFFLEYVRRQLLSSEYGFNEADVLGGGLKVQTSLDLRMQAAAENAVASTLDLPDDPEAALIAMDSDGNVKAMVGGRDVASPVRATGFNFAANIRKSDTGGRQAGSAFKPFALARFLEEGKSVKSRFPGPSKIQIDSPRCRNEDGTPWQVSNFESESAGTIDVVEATARSVNTIYAQLMDKVVSPAKFIETAADAGIAIPKGDTGCALTLGTSAVTPLEMARAFTTFAARGKRPDTLIISKVTSPGGKVLSEQEPNSEQTIDTNVADTVNHVLQQPIQRGTATGAKIANQAAGKTGTTQNHVDAWFAGYTPALTAVVWMGFAPDSTGQIPQMTSVHGKKVTGGSFPATIWKKFMVEALKGVQSGSFVKPNLTGEVVNGAPVSCPSGSTPAPISSVPSDSPEPAPTCLPQSPSPTPSEPEPTPSEPQFDFSPPPFSPQPPPVLNPPIKSPPPKASPSPSPTPSPSPSPAV